MKIFSENFVDFKFKNYTEENEKTTNKRICCATKNSQTKNSENFLLFSYQSFSLFFLRKIFTAGSQKKMFKLKLGTRTILFLLYSSFWEYFYNI